MEFCRPTKDEFCRLAEQGNLIPVTRRLLADQETPLTAYRKIRGKGESFLFESVEGGEHLGRYSFVGSNPRGMIRQVGDTVELRFNWHTLNHRYKKTDSFFGTCFYTLDVSGETPLITRKVVQLNNDYIHQVIDVYHV
nr:aromatic-ring-hydroxylating dioxygenase subunit beta [uncultured Halomonas sp.]